MPSCLTEKKGAYITHVQCKIIKSRGIYLG